MCDLCSLIYESIADAVDRVKYEANKITEGFDTLFKWVNVAGTIRCRIPIYMSVKLIYRDVESNIC